MAKTWLSGESVCQHSEGIVGFPEVGGVDLAGVTGEHHLGSFSDASEDRSQRRWFKVLCFVDDNHLLLERPASKKCHRFERDFLSFGEFIDELAGVA